MLPFIAVPIVVPQVALYSELQNMRAPALQIKSPAAPIIIPEVPFYSQFKDIQSPKWRKVGCGITSLAMIIDFYDPGTVSVNTLLKQGIAAGAYKQNAGWTGGGLILVSQKYGFDGNRYDLSRLDEQSALARFKDYLKDGPVIVSVHYKFDPKSTIPHLVVIDGIENDVVYYNDPASNRGEKQISVANFLKGWKKKIIVVRPIPSAKALV
jgi:uncharacterized protein YvpB